VPDKVLELGTPEMLNQDLVLMQANFARFHDSYALALLDVDDLQGLIAVRGEDASKEAVNLIAATIAEQARSGDSAYELGGDGFAIIFPFQGATEARAAAERIRCAVEELAIPDPRSPSSVLTISAGISAARPNQSTTTLEEADVALRHAKATGRNRVCAFEEPATQNLAA
jgi:diguanylate cyclase (GGDEF)-like protein